jgi:4-carboxymuconolactone decarboxylase
VSGVPRIAPIEHADEDLARNLAKAPQSGGRPLHVFTTLAHDPRIFRGVNILGSTLMFESSLSDRQRELVILRTAAHARSAYEIHHHSRISVAVGVAEEEVAAALDIGSVHPWAPDEAALLRVADELSTTADVGDAAWAALDGVLGDAGRIELLTLVGFYRMVAGVLNGARVQLETD